MSFRQTRVAVLFRRLGPYHHARLNAAGKLMEIFGVEACGAEDTYAWEKVAGATSFTRMTLTDRQVEGRSWRKELRRKMWEALHQIKPGVVAVPGWSFTDALSALSWCIQTNTPAVIMSESTEWDEPRTPWKEWMKRRLVGLCSVALAGGTPHVEYLKQLGLPAERMFSGYDAVDNSYFADKVAEVRGQKSEVRVKPQSGNAASSGQRSEVSSPVVNGPVVRGPVVSSPSQAVSGPVVRSPSSVVREKHGLPEKYFLASARFVEKKNLLRLLQAYARYRTLCEARGPQDDKTTALQTTGQRTTGPQDGRSVVSSLVVSSPSPVVGSPVVSSPSQVVSSPVVPWSLVLLGDGPLRSSIFDLRSSLGLDACVHLPGFKQYDELPTYYGLASAFVHASTTEQWGLVVNEAMASGLPVLVSNRCGCATDLVKDGVNGFTFDPFNVEQLAELMLRLTETTDHGPRTTLAGTTDYRLRTGKQTTDAGGQRSEVNLEDIGNASREIISHWGPERFASGLKSAVEKALEVGPVKSTLPQRMILKAMLWR